jgi:bifunctional polynucleotide phosphatase/kinase
MGGKHQSRKDNNHSDPKLLRKLSPKWTINSSVIVLDNHSIPKQDPTTNTFKLPKIAAFDLDSTLIKVKSGAKFPKSEDDFILLDDEIIPAKLQQLVQHGYDIVIFTNQLNSIQRGIHVQIMAKIESISKLTQVPISAYISSSADVF